MTRRNGGGGGGGQLGPHHSLRHVKFVKPSSQFTDVLRFEWIFTCMDGLPWDSGSADGKQRVWNLA
jgi:hypothetical protein